MAGSPSSTSPSTSARCCRAAGRPSGPSPRARSSSTNCASMWPGPWGPVKLASAAWRWSAGRPRVTLGLAMPHPWRLPGIVSIDGIVGAAVVRRDASDGCRDAGPRRTSSAPESACPTGPPAGFASRAGAALDRLREYGDAGAPLVVARDYLAVESSVSARLAADRIAVTASAGWWTPLAGGQSIRHGRTAGVLAIDRRCDRAVLVRRHRDRRGEPSAPLALWQGAGTGAGRTALLRAHRLVNSGVITGPVFGRAWRTARSNTRVP